MLTFPRPTPEPGDLVVRSVDDCPTEYVLRPTPAPAQVRYTKYAAAFNAAKQWARSHHVDVWFTDDDRTFVLLSRHRPDDLATRGPEQSFAEARR